MTIKIQRTNQTGVETKFLPVKRHLPGNRKLVTVLYPYTRNFEWVDITLDGQTRRVKAYQYMDARHATEYIFASRTRLGSKLHREHVMFEFKPDGKVGVYNSVALNRQAVIVGWWKPEYDAKHGIGSKHIGG